MGAGYHGGFGNTQGSGERNRIGNPVPPTERTYEMALNPVYYAGVVAKKYRMKMTCEGKEIQIIYNSKLPEGNPVKVRESNPTVIELGRSAFYSEAELANTIAHELNHVRSFLRGGNAPEDPAYDSGNALADYIRGGR